MISIFHSTARARQLIEISQPKAGAWVSVVNPTENELTLLADKYGLDRDLLGDAVDVYEAPRIESDEGKVYLFTRYSYPDGEEISTEPLLIIYTSDYLITVARSATGILDRLVNTGSMVTTQKTKLLLQILSEVNGSYRSELVRISRKILSTRAQLRKTEIDNSTFVQFIDMEEELNEFLSALQPQSTALASLTGGKYIKLYEEDKDLIEDLTLNTNELIELSKTRLKTISNTREAYSTIMANNLNRTFKRLTSISIFVTIPAITSGLYGMNLNLPLAHNPYAFWFILAIVMTITGTAIWYFQRKKWL